MTDSSERRRNIQLTEDQIDHIADRAAKKAAKIAMEEMTDHLYAQIGKGFVNKFFVVAGVVVAGLYFWLQSKGWIK